VWQVQPNGLYDVQDADSPAMNLRGVFTADGDGRYEFRTVRPVDYTIPDDGPVGQMLRATGRHAWRPAHVHIVAAAEGYEPVTTHLFDAASPHLGSDAVFGVRQSLVVDMDGGEASFDITLAPAAAG
jgi:catechol 1,2-dioxygenase